MRAPIVMGIVSVLLAGAARAGAQVATDAPSAETPPPRGVPTRLGQEVIAPSEVIAVVHVDEVEAATFGAELLDVRVVEPLRPGRDGAARVGAHLSVVTYPGVAERGERVLLFLRRMPSGERFAIVHRERQRDEHFAEKLDTARGTVALAAGEDAATRARATVDWLLGLLVAHDPWRNRYALGELRWMAARQAWALPPGSARRLDEAAARVADPLLAEGVENVAKALRERERRLPHSADKAPSSP